MPMGYRNERPVYFKTERGKTEPLGIQGEVLLGEALVVGQIER